MARGQAGQIKLDDQEEVAKVSVAENGTASWNSAQVGNRTRRDTKAANRLDTAKGG
jgi:hypothetical protein